MATIKATSVSDVVADILHQTVKEHLKQLFIERIVKDIEPILDDYTRQIVCRVAEMRDPYSIGGLKLNVQFKMGDFE